MLSVQPLLRTHLSWCYLVDRTCWAVSVLRRGEQLLDCPGLADYDQPASSSSQQISAHYLGFVQPLNHTRHRNPLVSVTFSPTQEARSQSAIWMLWSRFYFPSRFIFHPSPKTFQTQPYYYIFACVACCVFPFVYGQQSLYVSAYHSISFLLQKHFPHVFVKKVRGTKHGLFTLQDNNVYSHVLSMLWCHTLIA